ncbi:unknown protein [Desulfotalea psychrophila LSv54]|uniref:Uncharacterized protein n=1 Tax=Desulfotalea psychrophila (strain LSv54 / DSM 12343) TaxID=177439 RepID=Q6AIB6_DESPS|nr:unknown protein [Desulfotalea psychrophila LSv54]
MVPHQTGRASSVYLRLRPHCSDSAAFNRFLVHPERQGQQLLFVQQGHCVLLKMAMAFFRMSLSIVIFFNSFSSTLIFFCSEVRAGIPLPGNAISPCSSYFFLH